MLKIVWKRGEIAPEEQFLLLSTIFSYLMIELLLNGDQIFSSRQAVIRDNRSRDNESRLYFDWQPPIKIYKKALKSEKARIMNNSALISDMPIIHSGFEHHAFGLCSVSVKTFNINNTDRLVSKQ